MTTAPAATTTREHRNWTQSRGWPVPVALVALSAIPLTAGACASSSSPAAQS